MYLRRLTKFTFIQKLLGFLLSNYLKFVFFTTRWKWKGKENISNIQSGIIVFWHGHMSMAPFVWKKGSPFFMLISAHSDGRIISYTIKKLGIETIEGSSSGGGAQAFRKLLRSLKENKSIGMTPDGPRGPYHSVNEGIYKLARLSKCPVIPLSFAMSHCKKISSWDKFIIPFPFGKGALVVGPALFCPQNEEAKESFLKNVEIALENATHQAHQLMEKKQQYC